MERRKLAIYLNPPRHPEPSALHVRAVTAPFNADQALFEDSPHKKKLDRSREKILRFRCSCPISSRQKV